MGGIRLAIPPKPESTVLEQSNAISEGVEGDRFPIPLAFYKHI